MANHKGCWYCGGRNKGDTPLSSIVKPTIEPDGHKDHGHTTGFALCDNCAPAPILDLRVPFTERKRNQ